jgi:NADH:ubiquinone oxidoreductase subunit F (NADH-binding)
MKAMTPDEVVEQVKASGRGRGGAGFPAGLKWFIDKKIEKDIWYVMQMNLNQERSRIDT